MLHNFQNKFKKNLVALQPVGCKHITPLKTPFSRKVTFRNIPIHVIEFLAEL